MCGRHWRRLLGVATVVLSMTAICAVPCLGQLKGRDDVGIDRTVATETPPELNPVGAVHIPIGVPNSLDSLKTFVEAEGGFSPGVGSFGVSFWIYDASESKLWSPTMEEVPHTHGLSDGRALIPWSEWIAGGICVRTEVCEAKRETDERSATWSAHGRHYSIRPIKPSRSLSMSRCVRSDQPVTLSRIWP